MNWSFTPNYIRQTEAQVALGTVTAARWNELWNLNITQGDHSEIALNALINTSLPAFEAELKAYTDTLEGELATTAGASKIGINAITGVMGTTVQAVAAGLKSLIDTCYKTTDANTALNLKETIADANALVKTISFDAATGKFTFTHQGGTTTVIDTNLEKVVVNFSYDNANQRLVMTDTAGTVTYVPLSDFITETEFVDSAQLDFSVSSHVVTATIKSGSITDAMLSSALITTLQGYVSSANTAATNAAASEANASTYKTNAADSAAAASNSATTAANSASSASGSASSAASSAGTATQKATAASDSAAAAAASASNAATSAQSAADSASQAAAIAGGDYLLKTGDASNTTVTYTEAASKTALASGEKLSVALGKIKKWFSSLGSAAFTESSAYVSTTGNASNVINSFTQAASRTNLVTGEKLSVSLGKIMKWYADFGTAAFSAASSFAAAAHTHTKSNITDFPTSLKNPSALTFGSKTYDGSAAATVTAADLGAVTDISGKQSTITASGILKGAGAGTVSAAARGTDYSLVNAPVIVCVPYTGWVKNATTNAYEQSVTVVGLLATDDKRTRVEIVGSTDVAAQALIDTAAGLLSYVACNTNGTLYMRCDSGAPATTFSVAVVIAR